MEVRSFFISQKIAYVFITKSVGAFSKQEGKFLDNIVVTVW